MDSNQVGGILRAIFAAIGGWLVGKGMVDAGMWETVGGAIVTLVVAGWSWWTNKQTTMVSSVNAMPEVKGVITQATPPGRDLAAAVTSATVAPAGTAQATAVAS